MTDRSVVDLIEDWQTGALFVFVALLAGTVLGTLLRSIAPPYGGAAGFVAGGVVAFSRPLIRPVRPLRFRLYR